MKNRKYLTTIILILGSIAAIAQPRSFSTKPEIFIEEISKYISTESNKKSDLVIKLFTTKWDSAQFVEIEQRNIINVSNQMLINDMRIPSFVLFLETMLYAKDAID